MSNSQIKDNLEKFYKEIPSNVTLCAVSKFHSIDEVRTAIEAGQLLFGENRVQEAYSKFSILKNDPLIQQDIKLHIIGQLQSNKVKKAVEIADCIQSVDSMALLEKIEKECNKINKKIDVFLELHTGEDSKSGFNTVGELLECVKACNDGMFPHVTINGLMTMAPFTEDELKIRESFRQLKLLQNQINESFDKVNICHLSMGMSGDYNIAIQEGSTMIRIGTAIFGPRI